MGRREIHNIISLSTPQQIYEKETKPKYCSDCGESSPTNGLNIRQLALSKSWSYRCRPNPLRKRTVCASSLWKEVQEHWHPHKQTESQLLSQCCKIHHPISSHTHTHTPTHRLSFKLHCSLHPYGHSELRCTFFIVFTLFLISNSRVFSIYIMYNKELLEKYFTVPCTVTLKTLGSLKIQTLYDDP